MSYKVGDYVLISNGDGSYTPRPVLKISADNKLLSIGVGSYQAEYRASEVHKCPKALYPQRRVFR